MNKEITVQTKQANQERTAVLIGTTLEALPTTVAHQLRQGLDTIETATQVFAGMVLVGRNEPMLVVVNVDRLGTAELDFLRIMHHRRRQLPVFVHASPFATANVDRAVRNGAAGSVSAEGLAALLDRPTTTREPAAGNTAEIPSGEFALAGNVLDAQHRAQLLSDALRRHDRDSADAPAPADLEVDEGIADEDDSFAEPESEASDEVTEPIDENAEQVDAHDANELDGTTGAARVPWLRYHDRPRRVGPQPHARPAPRPPIRRSPADEPLLTPEELDALLGNDLLGEDE